MYNSETEKTQMNVFNPSLGAEREVGVKGKTPIDMSLNMHFKNYFGFLRDVVVFLI